MLANIFCVSGHLGFFPFPQTPWSLAAVHLSIVTLTSGWASTKMASVILASCSQASRPLLPSNVLASSQPSTADVVGSHLHDYVT